MGRSGRKRSIGLALTLTACLLGSFDARSDSSSGAPAAEPDVEAALQRAFDAGELSGLHAVLVTDGDETIAEAYFPGADERWGTPIGERDHGPDTLHDLRSVTKPVVGLLYGIALAEGRVPSVDEPLLEQFPEYADLADDPARGTILIRHALSMRMGIEWNEDLPYSDPENSEIAMESADDRDRFVLDRPVTGEPGERWVYNGGAVSIVARLIADGVNMPIDEYAEKVLFAPLGITGHEWVRGGGDVPSAASGLRLNARDLAKIGRLVADGGTIDGERIVPADWLAASFDGEATPADGLRYGFFWWLAPEGDPPVWVAGFGNGGQRLMISPGSGRVIAIFAGNYNRADAWELPVRVMEDFVFPALASERDGG